MPTEPEYPEIEAIITTVLSAIRTITAELADESETESEDASARHRVSAMLKNLGEAHGTDAVISAGMLLAEAAANGFGLAASNIGHPIERILADYERHVREDIDFTLLMAREFPPESK